MEYFTEAYSIMIGERSTMQTNECPVCTKRFQVDDTDHPPVISNGRAFCSVVCKDLYFTFHEERYRVQEQLTFSYSKTYNPFDE